MRKPGDIEMVFGDPIKCTKPIGQAKLIEKTSNVGDKVEEWWVSYPNDHDPDKQYLALLKKEDEKNKTEPA